MIIRKIHLNLIFAFIFLFLVGTGLNAQLNNAGGGCCEKALNNAVCVSVPESQCQPGKYSPQSCDAYTPCKPGVCISINTGECADNTPNQICTNSGGVWKDEDINNIKECNFGCCILGKETQFITKIQCQNVASDYGVDFQFREDMQDSVTCLNLNFEDEEGACVINEEFKTECKRTLGKDCVSNKFSGKSVNFYKGMLCTANELNADCVPTKKTICYEGDVYYLDSCGNRANVFDSSKADLPRTDDYWTYIKKEKELCEPVKGGSPDAKSCGNCDYFTSSKCRIPQSRDPTPEAQDGVKHVCGDLRCSDSYFQGKYNRHPENTESWCAPTKGTPWQEGGPGIYINFDGSLKTNKSDLFNPLKYNLPGSEYALYQCYEGEILKVACADKREEICKQVDLDLEVEPGKPPVQRAYCIDNNAINCMFATNRTSCNKINDCYWLRGDDPLIKGHKDEGIPTPNDENITRYSDNEITIIDEEGNTSYKTTKREEYQGSCVPLFAPGISFWTGDGEFCAINKDVRAVVYSVGKLVDKKDNGGRNSFGEDALEANEYSSYKKSYRHSRCINDCFAIPNEGGDRGQYLNNIATAWNKGEYAGEENMASVLDAYYYNEGKLGKNLDRKDKPEFYTHLTWLKFVALRARAYGDCGVKTDLFYENPSYNSELVTTTIQKVKQDLQTVRSNLSKGVLYHGKDLFDLFNINKFKQAEKIQEGSSEEVNWPS